MASRRNTKASEKIGMPLFSENSDERMTEIKAIKDTVYENKAMLCSILSVLQDIQANQRNANLVQKSVEAQLNVVYGRMEYIEETIKRQLPESHTTESEIVHNVCSSGVDEETLASQITSQKSIKQLQNNLGRRGKRTYAEASELEGSPITMTGASPFAKKNKICDTDVSAMDCTLIEDISDTPIAAAQRESMRRKSQLKIETTKVSKSPSKLEGAPLKQERVATKSSSKAAVDSHYSGSPIKVASNKTGKRFEMTINNFGKLVGKKNASEESEVWSLGSGLPLLKAQAVFFNNNSFMVYLYNKAEGNSQDKKMNIKVRVLATPVNSQESLDLGIKRGEVSLERTRWVSWAATDRESCHKFTGQEDGDVKLEFEITTL